LTLMEERQNMNCEFLEMVHSRELIAHVSFNIYLIDFQFKLSALVIFKFSARLYLTQKMLMLPC
jgi:hypothetical protein